MPGYTLVLIDPAFDVFLNIAAEGSRCPGLTSIMTIELVIEGGGVIFFFWGACPADVQIPEGCFLMQLFARALSGFKEDGTPALN